MQHLIKVNLIVYFAAIASAIVALSMTGVPLRDAFGTATKVASVIQFASLAVIYFAWRWIPGFSYFVFPNIGGDWTGNIRFENDKGHHTMNAALHVDQNVTAISLLLTTENAESETMVVYPRRLSNRRLELLYVYETHKKESLPPPSYRYRGTAVMRLEGKADKLSGSYYTEQGGKGTVTFARKPAKGWFANSSVHAC